MQKYERYNQLLKISYRIAVPTLGISLLYFGILNKAISITQKEEAMRWSIILLSANCIFYLGFMMYTYLLKKVHDFMIWILVVVNMSVFVIPAVLGFGWVFVLVGIPWGMGAFYTGKFDQERWKEKQLKAQRSL